MPSNETAPYRYTECGLDNVLIHGIGPVLDDEGDEVITIENVNGLHKSIACAIVKRKGLITGKELRFLRTEMGLTQAELAQRVHKDTQTVGRWERGEKLIDQNAETLIRLMAAEKLHLQLQTEVSELTGYSVQVSDLPPIRIDGSNPHDYRPMAA